jgi:redox-sensitive bicupin YhaK (pirin superfamily)
MKKSDMTSSWWEQVLLIAGVPLNGPIARYGPFVMNTETEIHQAFEDYRRGRMGAIKS